MSSHSSFSRDFSRKTIRSLASKGMRVVGGTLVPCQYDSSRGFADPERAYQINHSGRLIIRSFQQVLDLAK